MAPDLAHERELEQLRKESLRHLKQTTPVALMFLCLSAACLLNPTLKSFGPIAAFSSFMMVSVSLFHTWVLKAPGLAEFKDRISHRLTFHGFLFCTAYLVHAVFEDEVNGELMRGARYFLCPLAAATEGRDEMSLFKVIMLLSALETAYLVVTELALQRCFVNLNALVLMLLLLQGRADVIGDRDSLAGVCRTVRRLLGAMCDGYFVLDGEGVIVAADQKLLSLLGADAEGRRLGSFMEEELTGWEGLRHVKVRVGGRAVNVELYSVPGEFTAASLREVLGHWCLGAERRLSGHLCALRESGGQEEASLEAQGGAEKEDFGPCEEQLDFGWEEPENELLAPSEADRLSQPPSQAPSVRSTRGFFPSMQLLDIEEGDYTRVKHVYHGVQTAVWHVQGPTGQSLAMKEVRLAGVLWRRDFPKNLVRADRELRSMKRLQWASCVVVQIVEGWLREDMVLCIVMEWLPLTLKAVLEGRRTEGQGPPAAEEVGRWCSQVAAGLAVMHAGGLMHRDLKASNLLLTQDLQHCKVADFGLSRELHRKPLAAQARSILAGSDDGRSEATSGYTAGCGTKGYRSLEVKSGRSYGLATDVFSLGCVLLELLTLERPDESRTAAAAAELLTGQPLAALCLQMLEEDPAQRPTTYGLARAQPLAPYMRALLQRHPELQAVLGRAEEGAGALGVLRVDAYGLVMDCSAGLAATFGMPADAALGRGLAEFLAQEGIVELAALLSPVMQEAACGAVTFQLHGEKLRLQVSVRPWGRAEGLQAWELELRPLDAASVAAQEAGLRQRRGFAVA